MDETPTHIRSIKVSYRKQIAHQWSWSTTKMPRVLRTKFL